MLKYNSRVFLKISNYGRFLPSREWEAFLLCDREANDLKQVPQFFRAKIHMARAFERTRCDTLVNIAFVIRISNIYKAGKS